MLALFITKKMNKTLFVTVEEIKILLGISGTGLDTALAMYVQAACNTVCSLIRAHEIIRFSVTDEEVEVVNPDYLTVAHLPIDWTQTLTVKDASGQEVTDTLFKKVGELRTIRVKGSDGLPSSFGGKTYFVTYSAGFVDTDAVPMDLKYLVAQIAQAAVLKVDRRRLATESGGTIPAGTIKKYTLGTKQVEYFSPETNAGAAGFGAGIDFEKTVDQWASRFKKFKGFA